MEKIYRVQMNSKGMPNFGTAVEVADRPQGEWIRTGRTNIYGGIEVQCSNCGDRVMVQHLEDEWYCRHCGADMGMKGADDYERAIEQMEHDMLYEPTYNSEDGSM
jgi:ribosomal protein L37AE/L43A